MWPYRTTHPVGQTGLAGTRVGLMPDGLGRADGNQRRVYLAERSTFGGLR